MNAQSWYSQIGQLAISAMKKAILMRMKSGSKTPLATSESPTMWQPLCPLMVAEQNGRMTHWIVGLE